MSQTSADPDTIIAHVELLRALDRLLRDAEAVRAKREALERLVGDDTHRESPATQEAHRAT